MHLIPRELPRVESICEMTLAITKKSLLQKPTRVSGPLPRELDMIVFGTERSKRMWTLFLVFGLLPVLVFIGLTIQQRLFKNSAAKRDVEWELYRQRWD